MTEKTRKLTGSVRSNLSSAVRSLLDGNNSFALWRLPNSQTIHLAGSSRLQKLSSITLEDSEPGFLFAPFLPTDPKIFLPAEEFLRIGPDGIIEVKGQAIDTALTSSPNSEQKPEARTPFYSSIKKSVAPDGDSHFVQLVNASREAVRQGLFEKVVPSRSKAIPLPEDFDLIDSFVTLDELYPTALVSVFSSPESGTWIGATPEMLVTIDRNQHFHTAALAGTQPHREGVDVKSVTWTQKEIEEQALVERYVIGCFKKIRLREFEEHGPKTVVAGNVLHLKTIFEVDTVATRFPQLGSVMLQLLHPTSAVCGMPLEPSLRFLLEHEGYDRLFYSGHLGPVNVDAETYQFVNLRCAQLFSDAAILYAGAGVLADSDPEKERVETDLKMNTLLRIIRP